MVKYTLLCLLLCIGITLAQSSLIDFINYHKLNENVLVVQAGKIYPDKVVAVKSAKGIILFDTGISPTLSEEYRKIIISEFGISNFAYVVNTHHHFDHTNGNQIFDDAVIIAHDNCPAQMKEANNNLEAFINHRRERYQRRNELAMTLAPDSDLRKRLNDLVFMSKNMCDDLENNFILTLPELTFNDELTIDLGDMTLELIYFPPGFHTNNDVIAIIPESALIFTGDLLTDDEKLASVTSNNDLDQVVKVLDKIISGSPNSSVIITIHNGILPFNRLVNFRDRLKEMSEEIHNKKSLVYVIEKDIAASGLTNALNSYEELKNDPYFYLWEGDLIELANKYFLSENKETGIALFELCAKLYPESVNANEWLGDAYYQTGYYQKAESAFGKALELNPVDSFAADMIYAISKKLKREK